MGTRSWYGFLCLCCITAIYISSADAQVTIGSFTGGDPGEGLDFSGNFQYAVNVRGPAAGLVGNANFTVDTAPGVTVTAPNEILNWHAPNYGPTANDNNLELVMQSIRWNTGTVSIDLANLTPGEDYRLQLLFAESCCDRGFNVVTEGTSITPSPFFNVQATQGGINNTARGAFVAQNFIAGDNNLDIDLLQTGTFADNNPIINGLTLEFFPDATAAVNANAFSFVAEPGDTDSQTLTITNNGEAGSQLVLNAASISGLDAGDFTFSGFTPGTVLDQGEFISLLVEYTGQNPGDSSVASLDITTNLGTLFGAQSGGQTLSFSLSALTTPEPATMTVWALFGVGAIGYCAWRRRRRN